MNSLGQGRTWHGSIIQEVIARTHRQHGSIYQYPYAIHTFLHHIYSHVVLTIMSNLSQSASNAPNKGNGALTWLTVGKSFVPVSQLIVPSSSTTTAGPTKQSAEEDIGEAHTTSSSKRQNTFAEKDSNKHHQSLDASKDRGVVPRGDIDGSGDDADGDVNDRRKRKKEHSKKEKKSKRKKESKRSRKVSKSKGKSHKKTKADDSISFLSQPTAKEGDNDKEDYYDSSSDLSDSSDDDNLIDSDRRYRSNQQALMLPNSEVIYLPNGSKMIIPTKHSNHTTSSSTALTTLSSFPQPYSIDRKANKDFYKHLEVTRDDSFTRHSYKLPSGLMTKRTNSKSSSSSVATGSKTDQCFLPLQSKLSYVSDQRRVAIERYKRRLRYFGKPGRQSGTSLILPSLRVGTLRG